MTNKLLFEAIIVLVTLGLWAFMFLFALYLCGKAAEDERKRLEEINRRIEKTYKHK